MHLSVSGHWAIAPRAAVNVRVARGWLRSVCSPQHDVLTPQHDTPHKGVCSPTHGTQPPCGLATQNALYLLGLDSLSFHPGIFAQVHPQLGTLSSVSSLPAYLLRVLQDEGKVSPLLGRLP